MRQFFRAVLLALVLLTVFLVSAMTAMRVAIHGREVAVPKFVGLAPAEAERLAASNGLLLDTESRFYSPEIPAGRIMSQLPAPGEKVRRGWKVRVAQSMGPQRVAIPNVVGQSQRAAEINLRRRGLETGTVAVLHLPNLPPDQIIAQSPAPNAADVASPKVSLLLNSAGESNPRYFVTPDFTGHHFGDATSAMAEAGFRVGEVTVTPGNTSPESGAATKSLPPAKLKPIATDIVIKQFPAAGQKLGAGAAINFELIRP
jgi:beta-lactam-binding protein with PASTA domain